MRPRKRGAATRPALDLRRAIEALRAHHGSPMPPPTSDPFELVLWENVAYLARPAGRREAFELLKREVGTAPAAILSASQESLEAVTSQGILKSTFAGKLRECAEIAIDAFGGDLESGIRGSLEDAKRALRVFPGIGEPGAEKILLFAGRHPLLAPDSDGLRVLARLGFIREEKSYSKTYAASRRVAKSLPAQPVILQEAHLLLQQHGQTLCRRSSPRCDLCPLATECAHSLATEAADGSLLPAKSRRGANGKPARR